MEMRTHNMPSGRLKKGLFEVDEAMFRVIEKPRELLCPSWAS
jgi:hypothetical protein